jgi:uncharacterized protein (DUF1697 family)
MRYVALLRAVNVGGRTVKMDRLRELFVGMRLRNVETFIASGNVIFETTAAAGSLEARIERHLLDSLGFAVPTLVRSAPDLAAIAGREPFTSHPPLTERGGMYVGFLKTAPSPSAAERLATLESPGNTFAIEGRELYWRAEDRRAVLEIPITKFERALGCPTTFRNVTTVNRIADRYCR